MSVSDESAIQGLILLGRSREEAIKEVKENEDKQYDALVKEWWNTP